MSILANSLFLAVFTQNLGGGVVTCGNVSQLLDEHKIFYWTKLVLLQDQTVKGMAGKSMPQTAFISQMLC